MASAIQLARTLALAGAALIATQASAAAFNGPYVGANIGWQQDKGSTRWNEGEGLQTATGKVDGFTYGGFLGYNYNINGNGIVGLEASLNGTSGSSSEEDVRLDIGTRWDIVGRAGALISPQTLVYVRGGYTNQKYSVSLEGLSGSYSISKGVWTAGAGVEQAFTPNITGRVEYSYAKYGKLDASEFYDVSEASIRPEAHAVRVGVAYNF